jgi:CRP/FNR family cyclic AMP-dependent transcriptional regulator
VPPRSSEKERDVTTTDMAKMLGNVPIFSGLSKKELEAIARAAKEVSHREGSTLAKEGESGMGFFLITDGTASVSVGGRARTKLKSGDFFGEISLIDSGPRTATVTAETPVKLLGLTQWSFKRLIEQNPAIAAKMLKVMAQRLRSSSKDVRA